MKIELPIEDLLLDLENPRIGTVESQSAALRAIIELDPRHFRTMMRSISDHGLDPGDAFYILEGEDDGYVVVDGNRRLAALKVLHEPSILDATGITESTARQLRKAREGFEAAETTTVDCVRFDDRTSANEWILRRHGRGQEGEERIAWGTLEIQRFQKDRSILDVIDFVARNSTFDEARWREIRAAVEDRTSVLRRFLESKTGRDWLGLSTRKVDGETLPAFSRDPKLVLGVLSRILDDMRAGTLNTRTYNKAAEIAEYFEELPAELHPPKDATPKEKLFRDVVIEDEQDRPRKPTDKPVNPPPPKTTRPMAARVTLAPAKHPFKQPTTSKGQQLVREASKIRIADMPLAAAYVWRAFLQHTVDIYMQLHNLPFWENDKQLDLGVRADRVIDHLIQAKAATAMDLRGARRVFSEKASKNPSSLQALNDYHHDRYQVPTTEALRTGWDSSVPLFVAVYGAVS